MALQPAGAETCLYTTRAGGLLPNRAVSAVLNVAGADLIEMIRGSALLVGELDRFLMSEGIVKNSIDEVQSNAISGGVIACQFMRPCSRSARE